MMRASAAAERAGYPTASLVCDGFLGQAAATASGLGVPGMATARLIGHVDSQDLTTLSDNVLGATVDDIVSCLTNASNGDTGNADLHPGDIAFSGDYDAVLAHFEANRWSDGLPIVPPTAERVAQFVAMVDQDQFEVLGVMKSSGRAVTTHNVAVNGVMAGCKAEHMPVLVAIAQVLTDPAYGSEHSGDTTSGEAQIIISGPVVEQLGFNTAEGVLREGNTPNTSIGRFLRLLMRNVACFLPGDADKATFGHATRVVLAEDASAMRELGWPGYAQDQGFGADDSIVTLARFTGDTVIGSIYGNDANEICKYLADGLARQGGWELAFTAGFAPGTSRPLVIISPLVANTLAKGGFDKARVRDALFEYARIPAHQFERCIGLWSNLVRGRRTLNELVASGEAAPVFAESDDPDRLVPVVAAPEHIQIVVAGDPRRSNAMAHGSNGMHGMLTSRLIRH